MKKQLLIFVFLLSAAIFAKGQSTFGAGSSAGQAVAAQNSALDFTAEVNGDYLIITFENIPQSSFQLELYDITGRRIAMYKGEKAIGKRMEFSLNQALPRGLYIVRVTSGKQAATKKVQL